MADLHYMGLSEKKLVIFVDILGFSQMVLSNEQTTLDSKGGIIVNLPSIYKAIASLDYDKEYQEHKNIKFLWVSDSIVITTDPENIEVALGELQRLIRIFYSCSFSLRGAITVGALHHEDNIWGPAFVHAVTYEKKANFPRVIIKKEDAKGLLENCSKSKFFKETEDPEFLFYDFFDDSLSDAADRNQNISAMLNVCSKFINENLDTQTGNTLEKYKWLGKQLKGNLRYHQSYIQETLDVENVDSVHQIIERDIE